MSDDRHRRRRPSLSRSPVPSSLGRRRSISRERRSKDADTTTRRRTSRSQSRSPYRERERDRRGSSRKGGDAIQSKGWRERSRSRSIRSTSRDPSRERRRSRKSDYISTTTPDRNVRRPRIQDPPKRRRPSSSRSASARKKRDSRSVTPPRRRRKRKDSRSTSPRRHRDRSADSPRPPPKHRRRSLSRSPSPPRRKRRHTRTPSRSPPPRSRNPLPSQEVSFRGEGPGRDGASRNGRGRGRPDGDGPEAEPVEKQKPNFGTTGLLAKESNTVANTKIVLKYSEPPEARKPPSSQQWRIYVFKGAETLTTIPVYTMSCWLVGREAAVADLLVEHPSCSKQHAAIQFRHSMKVNEYGDRKSLVRPYLIDLESANGTLLNGEKIAPSRYVEVRDKDVVKFGLSEREYVFMLPPRE